MYGDSDCSMTFDYIVCGGGTSGCVIASILASRLNASFLLVEAGRDTGVAPDVLVPGKYLHQLETDSEGLWHLPTVPQKELEDRSILFLRGKQLGGSSAVNYMALARGPASDYDEWADLTEDDQWTWENTLPLMKELEDFRPSRPSGFEHYAEPDPSCHGQDGPLKVGFGDVMSPGVELFCRACKEVGIPLCLDNNAGNPIGVGLAQFNTRDGIRSYSANAFLSDETRQKLPNLTVLTNTCVDQIVFEEQRAKGVKLFHISDNSTSEVLCRKEVIVCQGTFGSPQLLMLSGVGPKESLEHLGIRCIVDNQNVGQGMLDHSILTIEYQTNEEGPAHNQIFADPELLAKADAQYAKDRTGAHNVYGTSGSVAFPKIRRLFDSSEFEKLDQKTQRFMLESTRPSAEIWLGSGPAAFGEVRAGDTYMTHELLLQNNLSKGSVSLQSANPREPPRIDPRFLEHPFDKRIAIETVREAVAIGRSSAYQSVIRCMVHGPEADDDESILRFIRATLGQGYHSLGTCRMGPSTKAGTVVDQYFKPIGTQGLRVADLSVCPILTSNHTQINVYLIGKRCADAIVRDFHSSSLI
ncbi:hypothetical protein LTR10_018180 [Elasticomyces elasticus]|uniref:Glucose-methanol-choline oxidoreductase N-terminal domain-containing protein n=1 Tax=Exophiala sideris TaxID=1016849 RepID=A0ABR0J2P3_9EURO|nr:hypothetical protein LTR10_018180 [Elasticomyces elasticus]KAK5024939.1 hypothetical protein LTS07_008317 [Exophiala sideris]KAK5031472.1 hypothetical protein LTR13_007800 [Exophiala sideris]KAK5054978.1 hypothetical protein LTR69_008546 [Exophiala sideris]KAK5179858.1 hypothetical protein LTR44_007674 [Eurotiomycetes sp. CCFEE 6388]